MLWGNLLTASHGQRTVPIANATAANSFSNLSITVIKDISEEQYQCTVKKGQDIDQCTFNLTVNVHGAPIIERNIQPRYNIFDNEDFSVRCTVLSGWRNTKLEWNVHGPNPRGRNSLFRVEGQTPDLVLLKSAAMVTEKELYRCTCTASNKYGTSSINTTVVIRPSAVLSVHPYVTTKSMRVLAYDGQNVTLTCEERRVCREKDISPSITWYHYDSEIAFQGDDESKKQCRDIGLLRIRLRRSNVTLKDQGTYRCEVENSHGLDDKTIQLVLVQKGFLNVTAERSQVSVQVGRNVTLECVTTYPDVGALGEFWTLNGTLLQTNNSHYKKENFIVIQDRNSTQNNTGNEMKFQGSKVKFALVIHNVTQGDLGSYVCGVNTTLGMEKSTIRLQEITTTKTVNNPNLIQDPLHIPTGLIIGGTTLGLFIILIAVATYIRFYSVKRRMNLGIPMSVLYKYDVFVTFSGKDVEWVEEKLVPVFEKHCIKFCIHNRDFELGKPFVYNMIESIYSSRKILAIVSKNYMASNFCRGELQLALQRSVDEKAETSLVLLRLDDILKSKLPKILRKKTFLDYHDAEGRGDWESRLVRALSGKEEAKISIENKHSFERESHVLL